MPLLTIVLCAALLIAHGTGAAQTQFSAARGAMSASAGLREVQAQIRRYGCHRPQYANAIEGCRRLHARARALTARAAPSRAPAPRQGRSFFGRIFGGPDAERAERRRPAVRGRDSFSDRGFSWFDFGRFREASPRTPVRTGRYRTLCVRLCDGYYFPISYSTTRNGFTADATRCEQSCDSPAKLFVYGNPGGSPENMYDLEGNPYTSLDNAFLYRTEFLPSCRCKPEPWTEEAQAAYEERAFAEADRKDAEESEEADGASAKVVHANSVPVARAAPRPASRHRVQPRKRRRGLFGFWR